MSAFMSASAASEERAQRVREELVECWPLGTASLPTAFEVVAPIVQAAGLLFDLLRRGEPYIDLLEMAEFVEVTDDEWADGEALLALQHRVIDLLVAYFSSWLPVTNNPASPAALRAGFGIVLGLDRLVEALRWLDRERLHGNEVLLAEGAGSTVEEVTT